MPALLCFGYGYCAEYFAEHHGRDFDCIIGTVRGPERAAILNAYRRDNFTALAFDGNGPSAKLKNAIAAADDVLISVPPGESGDPVLAACADALARSENPKSLVYLSTVGVYGDHGGAWVDEETPLKPDAMRSRSRAAAEQAWLNFGSRHGVAVAVLRLAGIYGPGQNALVQLASGKARRIVKEGQTFNRIHVADIARAIEAAFTRKASGVFNVADDEPAPHGDPIVFAADLMGVPPPPEIAFVDAAASMSPMALSFWQDCRRVKNDKLKRELGVALRYPTYREGLKALFEEMQSAAPAKPANAPNASSAP